MYRPAQGPTHQQLFLSRAYSERDMKLTTRLHQLSRLRVHGATLLLHLCILSRCGGQGKRLLFLVPYWRPKIFPMIRMTSRKGNYTSECDLETRISNTTRVVPKFMSNIFFACELRTADEGECSGRWNQLLCYPWVSCDFNSLHHVTGITPNKMADNDMWFHQCALIEFLVKEEIPAAEIQPETSACLWKCVCMGASSVRRWVKHFKEGKTEAVQKAVLQCLRMAGTEFYSRGIFKLPERWEKCCTKKWRLCGKIKKVM